MEISSSCLARVALDINSDYADMYGNALCILKLFLCVRISRKLGYMVKACDNLARLGEVFFFREGIKSKQVNLISFIERMVVLCKGNKIICDFFVILIFEDIIKYRPFKYFVIKKESLMFISINSYFVVYKHCVKDS